MSFISRTREQGGSAPWVPPTPLLIALAFTCVLIYAGFRGHPLLTLLAGLVVLAMLVLLMRSDERPPADGRDELTGLPGSGVLALELEQRMRTKASPTLLLRFDLQGFKDYNDTFGRDAGDALLRRLAERLANVVPAQGRLFRLPGDEFSILAPVGEGEAEPLIDAATGALRLEGTGFRIGSSFGGVLLGYETTEPRDALRLADERLARHRRSQHGVHAIDSLADALSERTRGQYLGGRVETLAVAVGGLLGIHGDQLVVLARAAELYDLGRLSIPRAILEKPGPLDEREWEFIHDQTLLAERVVRTAPQLSGVAEIVRATEENWDGSGYPDGRVGVSTPLASRIIRVCQAYDELLVSHAERPPLTPEQALAQLEEMAGSIFDARVVSVLSALLAARGSDLRAA